LLSVVVVLLVLAGLAWWGIEAKVLGALLVVLALGVLLMRWVLLGVVRRLTGFTHYAALEEHMRALVDDTSSDVLRELRRIGLPGRVWTLPLLAMRFVGRQRRHDTLARLRTFEVERAVPKSRLDEMHIVLRTVVGGRIHPPGAPGSPNT
jgi:hypothetical protein